MPLERYKSLFVMSYIECVPLCGERKRGYICWMARIVWVTRLNDAILFLFLGQLIISAQKLASSALWLFWPYYYIDLKCDTFFVKCTWIVEWFTKVGIYLDYERLFNCSGVEICGLNQVVRISTVFCPKWLDKDYAGYGIRLKGAYY